MNHRHLKKIKLAIITGGTSNERSISLASGKMVEKFLDQKKFQIKRYDTKNELKQLFQDCQAKKIDVAFIAMHGKGGEDGSIQGMLELLKVPYTGSGVAASAISMNKLFTKKLLKEENILTPPFILLAKKNYSNKKESQSSILAKIEKNIGFPCVVKPASCGSSVGVSIVKNKNDIKKGLALAFKEDKQIIIEKYIKGQEITVGLLGNENPKTLPVIKITTKREFFDYQAKYNANFTNEEVPAKIPPKIALRAQKLARKIHLLLNCWGFSRVDMILQNQKIYVLEINTIPGLTINSLLPKAVAASGIPFGKFLEKLVYLAQEK